MALERFFDGMLRTYDVSLQWSLRHRGWVMAMSGVILVITVGNFSPFRRDFCRRWIPRRFSRTRGRHREFRSIQWKRIRIELNADRLGRSEPLGFFLEPWAVRGTQFRIHLHSFEGSVGPPEGSEPDDGCAWSEIRRTSGVGSRAARDGASFRAPSRHERCDSGAARVNSRHCRASTVSAEPSADSDRRLR